MHPYTVQCTNCGEARLGRRKDETVTPVRAECPHCAHDGIEILAEGDDD